MADRLGRRRLIVTALALMTVAMAASSLARSVAELAGIRFFVGCGIGTVLACIAAVAARSAPAEHRNFAVGILQGGYPVGAMITGFVTAWALPRYGWQHCLLGVAGVSALFVPLALAVLPREAPVRVADGHPPLSAAIAGPRRRATMLLWATTISGFMALYFITSWITRLAIAAGLPETQAIVASAVYNLGAFLGTLVMSLMGVKRDIRRICSTMLVCAAGMFLVFGGVKMGLAGVLVTAFLTGVTLQGGYNMVYPIVARVYPDDLRATGIGWAFGVGRIGAFIGPMLGGWALAMQWPLVAVFGIFCVPLLVAAAATRRVAFD